MKKIFFISICVFLYTGNVKSAKDDFNNVKPVRNVILMIPDGTPYSILSVTRWTNWYKDHNKTNLSIDPYLCGFIRSNTAVGPIADSGSSTSCYVSGHVQPTGFIGTYSPDFGDKNLGFIDGKKAYGPVANVFEAAHQLKGKSTGLVATVSFTHATPADCSAHYYKRSKTDIIATQIVHNNFDVVLSSGNKDLSNENEQYLKDNGYDVVRNDIEAMRRSTNNKLWALFHREQMPYDFDRDVNKDPSLAEMTEIAINKLNKNKKGFFLMVEGSMIDFSSHDNDPSGMLSEYSAFEKACEVAVEFAKKDGNTTVIVIPDHNCGGMTIGKYHLKNYTALNYEDIFGGIAKFTRTTEGMIKLLNSNPYTEVQNLFKKYMGFELTDKELDNLYHCVDYKQSPLPKEVRNLKPEATWHNSSFSAFISHVIADHTPFGFSSDTHTGEDVFLAVMNPNNQVPAGYHTNVELSHYIQSLIGMNGKMDAFSDNIFARHDEVFTEYETIINENKENKYFPTLTVKNPKNGKSLTIYAQTSKVELSEHNKTKTIKLPSVAIYVDKTNLFYLPKNLVNYLK